MSELNGWDKATITFERDITQVDLEAVLEFIKATGLTVTLVNEKGVRTTL